MAARLINPLRSLSRVTLGMRPMAPVVRSMTTSADQTNDRNLFLEKRITKATAQGRLQLFSIFNSLLSDNELTTDASNKILAGLIELKEPRAALKIFFTLHEEHKSLVDQTTYIRAAQACSSLAQGHRATWLLHQLLEDGLTPGPGFSKAVLEAHGRARSGQTLDKIWQIMEEHGLHRHRTVAGQYMHALIKAGMHEQAMNVIQEFKDSNVDASPFMLTQAMDAAVASKKSEFAIKCFQDIEDAFEMQPETIPGLARIYLCRAKAQLSSNPDDLMEHYNSLENPGIRLALEYVCQLVRLGGLDHANALLESVSTRVENFNLPPFVVTAYVKHYLSIDDVDAAMKMADKLGSSVNAKVLSVFCVHFKDQPEKLLDTFRHFSKQNPDVILGSPLSHVATALVATGQTDEMVEIVEEALLRPGYLSHVDNGTKQRLSNLCLHAGQEALAARVGDRSRRKTPDAKPTEPEPQEADDQEFAK